MASNLYPLVFKPGIKRDGTPFQAEYCTDGQWIRFYQGKARKIGGMLGASGNGFPVNLNITTIFPYIVGDTNYIFLGDNITGISYVTINPATFTILPNLIPPNTNPISIPGTNNGITVDTLWQIVSINNNIDNQTDNGIVCFNGFNLNNITNNVTGQLTIVGFLGDNIVTTPAIGLDPDASGGILYVDPTLFVYGNNGLLQWSSLVYKEDSANPGQYIGANIANFSADNSVNISNDKIIFGTSIRGGSLAPTLLFWTLSSVVRITNVAPATATNYEFKVDPVTKDCSILSSRCVVEHNGLFFWAGTDNFYFYNGVVDVMVNTMNLRYFFDNIDMKYRQKVFGVKNKKYNEIWWFYPEKLGTPGRPMIGANPIPEGTITKALIYNLTENSWYDTQIVRDCGYWDNVTGNMYTYGCNLPPNTVLNTKYLWKHEYQDAVTKSVKEVVVSGPSRLINSSFTTPTMSWAAFNPMKQLTGVDRWMDIKRIEPDFVVPLDANGTKVATNFEIIILSQEYAQSPVIDYNVPGNITQTTQKIDIHRQGRHVSFLFSSSDMFEMGHIIIELSVGDGR